MLPASLGPLTKGAPAPLSDRAPLQTGARVLAGGMMEAGTPAATGGQPNVGPRERTVSLSFADTDIRDVAQTILGSILNVTFTIDPAVQGTVSLTGNAPVARDEVVPTLEALLAQVNAVLVVSDGLYQIVPADRGIAQSGMAGAAQDGTGSEILVLRVASARRIADMLAPFVPTGAGSRRSPTATRCSSPAPARRAARSSTSFGCSTPTPLPVPTTYCWKCGRERPPRRPQTSPRRWERGRTA